MAWKPKEKALTPEEAVEQARRELAPLWLGTSPLLAGVRGGDGKATAHPLDATFEKKAWLIFFADLTDFSGEAMLLYAREWMRRYQIHDLNLLMVVRTSFSFLASAKDILPCLKKVSATFPLVLDQGGMITDAFGGSKQFEPAIKLLHQRQVRFQNSGPRWAQDTEKKIQAFLRLKDPGLALAPPFEPSEEIGRDAETAELGSRARSPLFKSFGKVLQESDRVVVQDPTANIRFVSGHSRISIVAKSLAANLEQSRIRVELNGDLVFDGVGAADLSLGDDSGSEVKVTDGRLYHLLQQLPKNARDITLRFPDAGRVPVAVYAIRFAGS